VPDETRDIDTDQPLESPARGSVVMFEKPAAAEDANATEETFTSTTRRIKLSALERTELGRLLDDAITTIKRQREDRGWDEDWDRWEDLYFGLLPSQEIGRANVSVPIASEIVDTAWAVIDKAVYGVTPYLQVMPREAMDIEIAKRKEQHLDYALTVEMHARERLDTLTWEMLVLNTGVCYLPWLRELDRVRDEETYDGAKLADMTRFNERYPKADEDNPEITAKLRKGKKVTLTVEYDEALHDAPDPQHIPLRDWIVRDTAQAHRLHRERFVGHRFPLRYADILEQIEKSYYDDVAEQLHFTYDADGLQVPRLDVEDKEHEITTGVVRWKRHGHSRERRYLVDFHQESKTILRIMYYPYWHNRPNYIPFYLQRSRRYIYGVSLVQKIESSQDTVNASQRLLLDSLGFAGLPMFKARKTAAHDFNPMRDGMFPGKTFYLDNPQDVEQFQMQVNNALALLTNVEQSATRHAELASGATQNVSGLESSADPGAPGNKTAILVTQAMIRIGKYLAVYGSSLSELGFQTEQLYYQFSPKGRVYRVMGEKGVPVFPTISRQDLRLRADYYPHGSTAALNPEEEKRDTSEALALLLKDPDIASSPLKRWAAIETALDALGSSWAQKKHKFLPSPEEMSVMRKVEEQRVKQLQQSLAPANPMAASPDMTNDAPPVDPQALALLGAGNGNGGFNAQRPQVAP